MNKSVKTNANGASQLSAATIWTIGHSNRDLGAFLDLLTANSIQVLADVRRFPGSKRQPQFGRENLETALGEAGIGYRHFPDLGGRRTQRLTNSPNTAWRVESFNAYADYMQSTNFQASLQELADLAARQTTVIMCAEALPWRCHRRLIADALLVQGWRVLDILSPTQVKERELTEFARVQNGQVTYPGGTLF
jgi:uncharacterized protein (DUF488 family)